MGMNATAAQSGAAAGAFASTLPTKVLSLWPWICQES